MTRAAAVDDRTAPDDAPESNRFTTSALASEIPFLLARARAFSTANANAALADVGLKVRTYSVLRLAGEALKPSQRELSEFLSLDPSQVVALVDELEQHGAVTRRADLRDRRSRIIVITTAGRRLLRKAQALTEAANDRSLSTLTPEERTCLGELLTKVVFSH